jgi:hypothetical protein
MDAAIPVPDIRGICEIRGQNNLSALEGWLTQRRKDAKGTSEGLPLPVLASLRLERSGREDCFRHRIRVSASRRRTKADHVSRGFKLPQDHKPQRGDREESPHQEKPQSRQAAKGRIMALPPQGTGRRRLRRRSKALPRAMRTSPPRILVQRGRC